MTCEAVSIKRLRDRIAELEAIIGLDRLDDWKRIQDSERKCESLEAEVDRKALLYEQEINRRQDMLDKERAEVDRLSKSLRTAKALDIILSENGQVAQMEDRITLLESVNAKLRDGLEWYAEGKHLKLLEEPLDTPFAHKEFELDRGEHARAVLEETKSMEGK